MEPPPNAQPGDVFAWRVLTSDGHWRDLKVPLPYWDRYLRDWRKVVAAWIVTVELVYVWVLLAVDQPDGHPTRVEVLEILGIGIVVGIVAGSLANFIVALFRDR